MIIQFGEDQEVKRVDSMGEINLIQKIESLEKQVSDLKEYKKHLFRSAKEQILYQHELFCSDVLTNKPHSCDCDVWDDLETLKYDFSLDKLPTLDDLLDCYGCGEKPKKCLCPEESGK